MQIIKMLGLLAFMATGSGLMLISLFNQSAPWVAVIIFVALGYFLGLIQHCGNLRS